MAHFGARRHPAGAVLDQARASGAVGAGVRFKKSGMSRASAGTGVRTSSPCPSSFHARLYGRASRFACATAVARTMLPIFAPGTT
jgi:hypothetical protein